MKSWLKILIALFFIGIIAVFLVYKFVYNKPHPDFESMTPDFTLNAKDLYNAYITGRTDAEKKYNGKLIEIDGALTKVETPDTLVIAVFSFNQGMFGDEGIRCTMLKKYHNVARPLPVGYALKVKGYCTGFNDTDVILEQCAIIK